MSSSFEKIHYGLRPNKSIERKMMCEALSRLAFIDHLDKYRYIGMGSPYFVDFSLFHKNLGIKDLVSIEKEASKKKRFDFNIPFFGITMHYKESYNVLSNLELHKKKNILWLDYDDKLSDYMFDDIDTFFLNTQAGSFFIISLNVEEDFLSLDAANNYFEEKGEKITLKQFRTNQLLDRVKKERIPIEFENINLNTKYTISLAYEMIERQINSTLNNRNANSSSPLFYKQIFNFEYKDNATILTIGGIIFDKSQEASVTKMEFESLSYYVQDSNQYKIETPNLTLREIKALDKLLPNELELSNTGLIKDKKFNEIPLNQSDILKYAKVYRYYPSYTEMIL